MMKAPNCPGGESGFMSGTSPTHFSPFQTIPGRVGSQGFPSLSAEARLYMTRRFAGQEKAHSRKMRARTSWSLFACPGGSIAFHFHCIQRDELVKVPSFSAKFAAGS